MAALMIAYYALLESICKGKTLGKWITASTAVMSDGKRLKFGYAVLRSICRLIPFDPISFFFKKGRWHDRIAGTKVVNDMAVKEKNKQNQMK